MFGEVVRGDFLGSSSERGFLYAYRCPVCTKRHHSTAPELTAPTLCHYCFTGAREEVERRRERDRYRAKRRQDPPPVL